VFFESSNTKSVKKTEYRSVCVGKARRCHARLRQESPSLAESDVGWLVVDWLLARPPS
jgi:hypothetical protein